MITILSHIYNEINLIEFYLEHYRTRFPGCKFVIYDHMSNDGSYELLQALDYVTIIRFDTAGKIINSKYLEIKNNAWRDFTTKWVCVCDCDELVDISQAELLLEENSGVSIIRTLGHNMVNMSDNYDLQSLRDMNFGYVFEPYSKFYIFNKDKIINTNYAPGCHTANMIGDIQLSSKIYNAYHYKFINLELLIARYLDCSQRVSDENKSQGLSAHYHHDEATNRKYWIERRNRSVKLFDVGNK